MAKGKKTGGRKKGTPNRGTREKEIAKSGLTPLNYMLDVLRNGDSTVEDKRWAANAAAPYVHPRLAAVQHTGKDGVPLGANDLTDIERAQRLLVLLAGGRETGIGHVLAQLNTIMGAAPGTADERTTH